MTRMTARSGTGWREMARAMRSISLSPVSAPIGLPLGPQILKPLYSAGLWLAVVWTPPQQGMWLAAK